MGWIVFEALLALALMLVAVWWTFRLRRDPDEPLDGGDADEPGPPPGRG